jgi:polysaccharide export outer membrane protein
MHGLAVRSGVVFTLLMAVAAGAAGQQQVGAASSAPASHSGAPAGAVSPGLPSGYVVGAQDVLSIVFWRDKDMSTDVTVRPDGKISLPLLNDVEAAGFTPEQLRVRLIEAASKYIEDPNATVLVKEIHSRNVFITGNVTKPSTYPLNGEMTVLQLIALAGGLLEYADSDKIVVIRTENGRAQYHRFNYKDVVKQKSVQQNIVLKPGDTVVVP